MIRQLFRSTLIYHEISSVKMISKASFIGRGRYLSTISTVNVRSIIPKAILDTISVMPEVATVINGSVNSQAVEGLKRPRDIFHQYSPKGEEYKAVLLLKAQVHSELNEFHECIKDLSIAYDLCQRDDEKYIILLARSKINWLSGKFSQALRDADLIRNLALQVHFQQIPLYQGLALNASALSMLAEIRFKDVDMIRINGVKGLDPPNAQLSNISEVVDTLRMASSVLRNTYIRTKQDGNQYMSTLGLASSTSLINLGVAELMYSLIKTQCIGSNYFSYDHAMQSFRDSLNILDEISSFDIELSDRQRVLAKTMRVHAFSNMAWTLLNSSSYVKNGPTSLNESVLKLSSEYAGDALKIAGELANDGQISSIAQYHVNKSLCLVASCYIKAGSAVTAEGLLRTAMDNLKTQANPMYTIDARSAYVLYYMLCNNWEKRTADAERAKKKALDLDKSLGSWEGMSAIYSGCSFLTIDEIS